MIWSLLTDSPSIENEFLSDENNLTSKSTGVVVRFHGRNTTQGHYWYNYLYSQKELNPWVEKIRKIRKKPIPFLCTLIITMEVKPY
jgi:uncharacterized protein YecE (DUF72 family)